MTTHELAKKLLEMPDVMATISGYKSGVNEVTFVEDAKLLHLDVNFGWYYGKHEYDSYQCENGCDHTKTYAIHIR